MAQTATDSDVAAEVESDAATDDAAVDDAAVDDAATKFPDVDVVNVATSESLNLADELSGGDLPVLLWFWAPF